MSQRLQMSHIKTQLGLSIVELMVTLVLSLFIMLVTTGFYINNKSTYRFIDSSNDVQESGRYAIHFLRETIVNAGFPKINSTIKTFPTASLPADGPGTNPDRISVSYQATEDCLGNAVVGTVTSTFTVVGNNLLCNNVQLIVGVENLQIEYGIDTDNPADNIPNTYRRAGTVANWDNVVAVRLAILLSSQSLVRDQASAETYQLLGVMHTTPNDRQHRRVFTTTIALRNADPDA